MSQLGFMMQQYASLNGLSSLEGVADTQIPNVHFYRSSTGNPRQPFTYQSGILILGQGSKNIYLGETRMSYGNDDFLVVGVPLPLECEALADNQRPLLELSISVDQAMLQRMVNKLEYMEHQSTSKLGQGLLGLDSVHMNETMIDVCLRLVKALCHPLEAEMMGTLLYEELIFRALTSEKGHVLFDLAHHEGAYAKVAKALNRVHSSYQELLTVQDLADEENMSISAFHQAFRAVTLESPLQYIKKVRLNKAKELIQIEGKRVSEAALMVGYNSSSQFSREYKRHFNQTPAHAK